MKTQMADDRKPKIDLKARLGKKTVAGVGGSVPPPVGIPKPGVPSALPSSVIPPPFGSSVSGPSAPRVDASDPYASIAAHEAPARAEPQAIKIELSDEVLHAQKKGRSRIMVLAAVTAVVGGVLGFALGSGFERGKRQDTALEGANLLAKDVDDANAQIEQLADVLKSAKQKLSESKYPEEEVSKLGGINIPFDGTNLTNRGIGLFKPQLVNMLIQFSSGTSDANDQKDKLQRVLNGSKAGILDFLAQSTKPKVRWSLFVDNGPYGPWATMQMLPEPFFVKEEKSKDGKPYSWPGKFEFKDGGKTVSLERYTKGEPMSGDDPKIIPVDPTSQGAVCPSGVLIQLRQEVGKLEDVLRGDNTPGAERTGLLETGQRLLEQLKQIGGPGA